MKLNILKDALQHYMLSADCSEKDREEVISALLSCQSVDERFESKEIWSDEVYVVTADMLSTLLNIATYDTFGRRARSHKTNRFPFQYYAYDCRKDCWLDELSDEQLQLGYDVVCDLWQDNEAAGIHKPDGTFDAKAAAENP